MRATISLLVLSVVALGCDGPLFFVEVEEPNVCTTQTDVAFPGAPGLDVSIAPTEVVQSIGNDVPLVDPQEDRTTVRVNRVTIRSKNGEDLSGFRSVSILISNPDGSDEKSLISYSRDSSAGPGPVTEITATGENAVNAGPYIQNGAVRLLVGFSGDLPDNDWTADIETCVFLKNKTGYARFLGL